MLAIGAYGPPFTPREGQKPRKHSFLEMRGFVRSHPSNFTGMSLVFSADPRPHLGAGRSRSDRAGSIRSSHALTWRFNGGRQ